mmetsp:Transcript_62179/g.181519  ORF Transcript_62179/g.181519 Transcript_62179/m.181519 type:complete len:101 (-) Transcript_62179:46-348(-)
MHVQIRTTNRVPVLLTSSGRVLMQLAPDTSAPLPKRGAAPPNAWLDRSRPFQRPVLWREESPAETEPAMEHSVPQDMGHMRLKGFEGLNSRTLEGAVAPV